MTYYKTRTPNTQQGDAASLHCSQCPLQLYVKDHFPLTIWPCRHLYLGQSTNMPMAWHMTHMLHEFSPCLWMWRRKLRYWFWRQQLSEGWGRPCRFPTVRGAGQPSPWTRCTSRTQAKSWTEEQPAAVIPDSHAISVLELNSEFSFQKTQRTHHCYLMTF